MIRLWRGTNISMYGRGESTFPYWYTRCWVACVSRVVVCGPIWSGASLTSQRDRATRGDDVFVTVTQFGTWLRDHVRHYVHREHKWDVRVLLGHGSIRVVVCKGRTYCAEYERMCRRIDGTLHAMYKTELTKVNEWWRPAWRLFVPHYTWTMPDDDEVSNGAEWAGDQVWNWDSQGHG